VIIEILLHGIQWTAMIVTDQEVHSYFGHF